MGASNVLAIIPARCGSKRLPGKNTKLFIGKPLVLWTVEAALASKYITKVLVTTDDKVVIDLLSKLEGVVICRRPDYLSTDTATSVDVAIHALEYIENSSQDKFEYIVFLQPTSPLRSGLHIDSAFRLLKETEKSSLVSVCQSEHHPLWSAEIDSTGSLDFGATREALQKRSQDLPVYYRLNGAVYIAKAERIKKEKQFLDLDSTVPFIMPQEASVDIDTAADFFLAEYMYNNSDK